MLRRAARNVPRSGLRKPERGNRLRGPAGASRAGAGAGSARTRGSCAGSRTSGRPALGTGRALRSRRLGSAALAGPARGLLTFFDAGDGAGNGALETAERTLLTG